MNNSIQQLGSETSLYLEQQDQEYENIKHPSLDIYNEKSNQEIQDVEHINIDLPYEIVISDNIIPSIRYLTQNEKFNCNDKHNTVKLAIDHCLLQHLDVNNVEQDDKTSNIQAQFF